MPAVESDGPVQRCMERRAAMLRNAVSATLLKVVPESFQSIASGFLRLHKGITRSVSTAGRPSRRVKGLGLMKGHFRLQLRAFAGPKLGGMADTSAKKAASV